MLSDLTTPVAVHHSARVADLEADLAVAVVAAEVVAVTVAVAVVEDVVVTVVAVVVVVSRAAVAPTFGYQDLFD